MKNGHIIAELRYEHNLSQKELSEILGVSSGAIAMWETNQRYPSTQNVITMSTYFNVTTDYLLGLENSRDINNTVKIKEKRSERTNNMLLAFEQLNIDNQDIIIGETKKMLKQQQSENIPKKKAN